mmetsp:Transcript_17396/g.22332  ORF Transcript_17396/g.22332 Transcript_17396/m.22332 type:complete len:96 (-) Transcript_17396:237-524(-)
MVTSLKKKRPKVSKLLLKEDEKIHHFQPRIIGNIIQNQNHRAPRNQMILATPSLLYLYCTKKSEKASLNLRPMRKETAIVSVSIQLKRMYKHFHQ